MNPKIQELKSNLQSVVMGSEASINLLIVGVLAGGHVLIQDAPGLGKTTLVKALAASIDCKFNRIQFTPDLLPSDILGHNIFRQGTNELIFIEGPIFANFVLADEINRTSPRVQSALLEAMNERQVSIDGKTIQLPKLFNVIATQNNLYSAGTFPLPEPQLDRFLFSFRIGSPDMATRSQILLKHSSKEPLSDVAAVLSESELLGFQEDVRNVTVNQNITDYISEISEATQKNEKLVNGISVRGSIALMRAAQAYAFMVGRSSVYPDDVKKLVFSVFNHRLYLRNVHGKRTGIQSVIDEIMQGVKVP